MASRNKKSQTKKAQPRTKKEEPRRKNQEGRRKKEEGRRKKSPALTGKANPTVKAPLKRSPAVKSPAKGFPIIGIGASAGGLDALERFFRNMPPDSGVAFVLISHLSPDRKSLMPEILRKHTKMSITQMEEGMTVEPNSIYVIPPNRDAIIKDGTLHLIDPYISRGIRHPIDVFFRSLADDQEEKSICVILSGTGTEGTLGLKAVKAEGGMVIVQEPASASYDGMPSSAIATGLVDYIAPPEEMPKQIVHYIKRSLGKARLPVEEETIPPDAFHTLLAVVREYTGHDFSDYKPSTIRRRIEKRMVIHNIEDIRMYVRYLRENPKERQDLFKEFLISVTKFFRDPEAFTSLINNVLPELFSRGTERTPLRIWVVGCSSGEEAYSLAIILREYMDEQNTEMPVQIFATDIDSSAIDTARAGVFPDGIAVDVSEARLKKYFTKVNNIYRIRKHLREMIVFSVQNVIKDPPFSKIDLICCRNLLIYVNSRLQKKMFNIFHYALNRGGFLFLGTSETVGESIDLFSVVDRKWKIYRRSGEVAYVPFREFDIDRALTEQPGRRELVTEEREKAHLPDAVRRILYSYTPACIVIDEKMRIRYFHGKVGRYLEPAEGEASLDLLSMLRVSLRNSVYMAVTEARQKKQGMRTKPSHLKIHGDYAQVTVKVDLFSHPGMTGWAIVLFEEKSDKRVEREIPALKKSFSDAEAKKLIARLQDELKDSKQSHQMTIEELETSNEELQSANEELQSSNEELQSTNEELETSREELQSLNEELSTVNAELQEKVREEAAAADEMQRLLSNMDIATIFLDSELRISRFTPQAMKVTNLLDRDIGRPFRDIRKNILEKDIDKLIRSVVDTMVPKQVDTVSEDGRSYLLRIIPYQESGDKMGGVVLSFVDMTEVFSLKQALAYTESIIDSMHESIIILDPGLHVISANLFFYKTFRVNKEETEGRLIYELGSGQWDIPKLRELLERILPQRIVLEDYIVEHDFPKIGKKKMLLNARQIINKEREKQMILLAIDDVTEKAEAES